MRTGLGLVLHVIVVLPSAIGWYPTPVERWIDPGGVSQEFSSRDSRRDCFCGELRIDGEADGPIEWQLNELRNREILAFIIHYELDGDGTA